MLIESCFLTGIFFIFSGNLCRPIHTPANGVKTCSGNRFTDTCIFSCSAGYRQYGSDIRTCTVSRRWSGEETKCERECTAS